MRHLWLVVVLLSACEQPAFPEKFLFGAATAGFQVDPGCPTLSEAECVDTKSDWYQWVTSKNELDDLKDIITFEPLANGPGYWELYEQDLDRAKNELGLNSVRVSLEWSRIFPTATDGLEGDALAAVANQQALAGYHAQFAAMKARGLTPMVTLNHYTLPVWIHDGVACHKDIKNCVNRGWLDRERTVREIAKYAGFAAKEFGGEVELWATENEPFALVLPGYLLPSKDRVNPPGVQFRFEEAKIVIGSLIEAHARMYDAVKANDPTSSVGLVYATAPVKPADPTNRLDVKAAENTFYLFNTVFLDAVIKGELDADLDGKPDQQGPVETLANRMDWLGMNFYTRITVSGSAQANLPTLSPLTTFDPFTIVPWEDYSKGIYDMQMHLHARYGKPIYVTETGTDAAPDDERVASWLVRHLEWTKRAMKDGADIRGFFYWSLMDNYEWNQGMHMRFGLYALEADKSRRPRSAVSLYNGIIKKRDISSELVKQYPPE
ncbi:MAG: glycoside hydrolase family 1 protein [Archangium sp.]